MVIPNCLDISLIQEKIEENETKYVCTNFKTGEICNTITYHL